MSAKQKILHGRGPSNINLDTFVYSFDVPEVRRLWGHKKGSLHWSSYIAATSHKNQACQPSNSNQSGRARSRYDGYKKAGLGGLNIVLHTRRCISLAVLFDLSSFYLFFKWEACLQVSKHSGSLFTALQFIKEVWNLKRPNILIQTQARGLE